MVQLTEKEVEKREMWFRLFGIIGIYLAIILLVVAIIVLVKNVEEIKTDPITYGIGQKDLVLCSCYDDRGRFFDYNQSGPMPTKQYGWNQRFPE